MWPFGCHGVARHISMCLSGPAKVGLARGSAARAACTQSAAAVRPRLPARAPAARCHRRTSTTPRPSWRSAGDRGGAAIKPSALKTKRRRATARCQAVAHQRAEVRNGPSTTSSTVSSRRARERSSSSCVTLSGRAGELHGPEPRRTTALAMVVALQDMRAAFGAFVGRLRTRPTQWLGHPLPCWRPPLAAADRGGFPP